MVRQIDAKCKKETLKIKKGNSKKIQKVNFAARSNIDRQLVLRVKKIMKIKKKGRNNNKTK